MRRGIQFVLAASLLAGVSWFWPGSRGNQIHGGTLKLSRPLMGTLWTIEVADVERPNEAETAVELAFHEVARIETLMSEWLPDSPISQINAAAGKHPVEVPAEVSAILRRALDYGARTEGAFDVTWRGMGSIWRFDDGFTVPSPEAVERARRNVDYRALHVDGNLVYLDRAGMSIGLGGIAKGYAVDRAAELLRMSGFPNSLVAGAGDILASGTKVGTPWRLGVQDPRRDRGALLGTLPLSGAAISTSGDYERFRIVDGMRYHHIIDPRTGWPARECITVSVVAPTAEQSDALSTAIFVLGPGKGLVLAREAQVDVLIVDATGKRHATGVYTSLR